MVLRPVKSTAGRDGLQFMDAGIGTAPRQTVGLATSRLRFRVRNVRMSGANQ